MYQYLPITSVVCLSVGQECKLCENGPTESNVVWGVNSRTKEPCIMWRPNPPREGTQTWAHPDLPTVDILNHIFKQAGAMSPWLAVYCSNLLSVYIPTLLKHVNIISTYIAAAQ